MRFLAAALVAVMSVAGAARADAQEITPGAGRLEVSIIPAGGVFFTENTNAQEPGFGNYDLGAAVGVNFNKHVGLEGEVSGAIGVTQSLQFGGGTAD